MSSLNRPGSLIRKLPQFSEPTTFYVWSLFMAVLAVSGLVAAMSGCSDASRARKQRAQVMSGEYGMDCSIVGQAYSAVRRCENKEAVCYIYIEHLECTFKNRL